MQDHVGVGTFADMSKPLQHFRQRISMILLVISKAPSSFYVKIGLDWKLQTVAERNVKRPKQKDTLCS